MKEIMSQFGNLTITVVVAIFCSGIIYGISGYGTVFFRENRYNLEQVNEVLEYQSVKSWYERSLPIGVESRNDRFYVNEEIVIGMVGFVRDMEGVTLSLQEVLAGESEVLNGVVNDIVNKNGESLLGEYQTDTNTLVIAKAGVYELYVDVKDRENLETTLIFRFVVDEEVE